MSAPLSTVSATRARDEVYLCIPGNRGECSGHLGGLEEIDALNRKWLKPDLSVRPKTSRVNKRLCVLPCHAGDPGQQLEEFADSIADLCLAAVAKPGNRLLERGRPATGTLEAVSLKKS